MDQAPGKVIRSLRQALNMSQAEFARAAGWSPSTISGWERGTSRPSRLAFKTILAFAEERGIRYQPKGEAQATAGSTLPVLRMPSRLPAEVVTPERRTVPAGREESFGSRRWTEMASTGVTGTYDTHSGARPERSAWQAEATLHVRVGAGSRLTARTGYVVAAMTALVLGLGIGAMLRGGTTTGDVAKRVETARADIAPDATVDAPDAAVDAPDVAADALPSAVVAAELADQPFPSGVDAEPVAAAVAAPAVLLARLESIVALDGVRRASFRVGDRSIALVEGDQLGGHAVARIENEDVTLVGGSDGPRRIRLGFETPLD